MDKQLFLFLFLLNIVKNNCIETNCSLMIAGYLPGIGGLDMIDLASGASTQFSSTSFIRFSYALTSDLSSGQLFFGDVSSNSHIYRVNLFDSTSLTIIRSYEGVLFVTEIVAETNLHVIFMTIQAENSSIIAKMNYDGTGYDEILFVDRYSAISMAVDQQDRKLYFNELGETRGISRSKYDGSDVEVFLEVPFPVALLADSHGRKLYFTQTFTLHVINFDGTDQRQLYYSRSYSVMSMTYLDGLLYFGASFLRNYVFEETRIMSFQLNGTNTLRTIATYYNQSLIHGMAVHCPLRLVQTNLSDELTSTVRNEVTSTVTSSIPTEKIPVRSETECSLVLAGYSLSPTGLAKVELATGETTSLAASLNIQLGYAVTSDQNTGQIFFNDVYTNGQIYSYNLLQSTGLTPLRSFDNGLYATGMVADTDMMVLFMVIPRENSSFIAKINYNGTGYQEIISQEPTSTSVALDQRARKLYYNDLGDTPQISRANYDGSNVEVFLDFPVLHMATDAAGGKLYFSQNVILEVINFDGSGRHQIYSSQSLSFNAMTYLNGLIYIGATYMVNDVAEETRLMSLQLDGSSASRVIATYSNDFTINGMTPFCRTITLQTTTTEATRSTTKQSKSNGLSRETVIIIAIVASGGVALVVGVVVVIVCCCRKRNYLADGDAYNASGKNISRPANKKIEMKDSYLLPVSNRDHQLGNFNHAHRNRDGYRPYLPNTSDGIMHGIGQYLTNNAINKQHQRNTTDKRHQYLNPRQTNYQDNSHYMNRGSSSIDSGNSGSGTYYLPQSDANSYASDDSVRTIGMRSMYSTRSNTYDKIPYDY